MFDKYYLKDFIQTQWLEFLNYFDMSHLALVFMSDEIKEDNFRILEGVEKERIIKSPSEIFNERILTDDIYDEDSKYNFNFKKSKTV